MTTLLMLSVLLFGVMAYRLLPVSDLPNVDYPTITVSASLPGANAETVAATMATPLEKEFSTISGVDSMSSTSSFGSTRITLTFALSRNIDAAAQDVQAAITAVARRLPDEMPSLPTYRKQNPAAQPILFLVLTSPTLSMTALDEYAENLLQQRISMVEGVATVDVFGSRKYAVRIELNPYALASRGIGIDEVESAVAQQNVNMPLGTLSGPRQTVTMLANGQITDASGYADLIVTYKNGQPVRLRELGSVRDSVENDKSQAWYVSSSGRENAIFLAISRQPGTNTVEVAARVKELLPDFREQLPPSISLRILRDGSLPITNSARDVQFTLLLTLCLVILVIFLFLRSLSATVIPGLTLPMSIIGTFTVMYLLDYSLDNLSLMALTLSVGFVVDDAIVMLENIVRHMEMGKRRMEAAYDGAREIGFTIISMTLSLAAVFIPVLFMGGIVGRLFREFSVTIGAAVLVSGFVSLTLTPMLASRFLRDEHKVRHHAAYKAIEAAFQAMLRFYSSTLLFVLDHRRTVMLFSGAVLASSVVMFVIVPKGFIPSEDRDQFSLQVEAAQDTSYDAMVEHVSVLAGIMQHDPNVDRFMCNMGAGGFGGGANRANMFVTLKPRAQRALDVEGVMNELRGRLGRVPGVRCYLTNPPPISVGGRRGSGLYQLTLQGTDTGDLYRYAGELERQMRAMPDLSDVSSDMQLSNPQLNVDINRNQALALGVSPRQIESALYSAYGTRQISTIYTSNNDYSVIMELAPEYQTDPSVLSKLYVRSSKGRLVPLQAMVDLHEDVGPLQINHSGQLPSVTISFNLMPNVALGQAINQLNQITRSNMPRTVVSSFQGTAQAFQTSLSGMWLLLALAIVVIYVVLGVLYESFYHPITILSALPFAAFGALLTLMIFRTELSIYAFVVIVMLVGLVKKNGIMMVDFALQAQRTEGTNAHDAIHRACMIRFRPIMMTTMAALMAGLPIALGFGSGAESRRPLGMAVVGGLLFSQTLTLYVTPVFYLYMEKFSAFVGKHIHWGRKPVPAPQNGAAAPDPSPAPGN